MTEMVLLWEEPVVVYIVGVLEVLGTRRAAIVQLKLKSDKQCRECNNIVTLE